MRQLTAAQKKLLNKFIKSQLHPKDSFEASQAPFKGSKHILTGEDLPSEIYAEIERLNDTEILWQEVNRYLEDESNKESRL
jgi:hypothetical protein